MKRKKITIGVLVMGMAVSGYSHFQELIPSTDIVDSMEDRNVNLEITFTHPMENGPIMEMGTPVQFGVLKRGLKMDLRGSLDAVQREGRTTYRAVYQIESPGDHIFFIEPAPYWEPAEGKMIVHYTKVVVDAFADGVGWDDMVGFPVEIEPLVRPYGLWSGNTFRGIVRKDGHAVPFAEVEVEYRNDGGKVAIPSDPFVTQVIKADANGVFAYTMPRAGWWSFAALLDSDTPMKSPQGKEVGVELGALIWVRCVDMK